MAMAQKAPPADVLQEGECWALVDSGAGVDGIDAPSVVPNMKLYEARDPVHCITANGGEMIAKNVVKLRVALDGQPIDIPFPDLPVTMPIISVRKHIHRGHNCRIREGGGYFRNKVTGAKSRLIEKDGVYCIRLKVLGQSRKSLVASVSGGISPNEMNEAKGMCSGFPRPEP